MKGIKDDNIIDNLKDYDCICSICNNLMERNYEYQTEKFGIENGVLPLLHVVLSCDKCRTVLKKEVNGYFVIGDIIDFDEHTVTIKAAPPPQGQRELTGKIILEHNLDVSTLKWFKDNLELAEVLVIDNEAVKITG